MDYIWDLSYCGNNLCFSALETEECSVFTPAVVRGDPDVFFLFRTGVKVTELWLYTHTHIYTHNFNNHIHRHCCSADVEKELQTPVWPRFQTKIKNSDVSNVSLLQFVWVTPSCVDLFYFPLQEPPLKLILHDEIRCCYNNRPVKTLQTCLLSPTTTTPTPF